MQFGVGFCVVLGDHGQESKGVEAEAAVCFSGEGCEAVSYTHLTLPTNREV